MIRPRARPFALLTTLFLFEIGLALISISFGPIKMRALASEITMLAAGRGAWFMARVFFCHILAASALCFLEAQFVVRRRGFLYSSLILYVFLFNVIRNPQIFDDFRLGDSVFIWLTSHLRPWTLLIPSFAFLACLWWEKRKLATIPIFLSLVILALVTWQIKVITSPSVFVAPAKAGPSPPSAVILSVDSLRFDAKLEPAEGSALSRLLERSFSSEGLVTPLAQTHGALTSLLSARLPMSHGVRYALSPEGLNSDRLLSGSATDAFRLSGVEVHLIRDGNDNDHFFSGELLTSSEEPGDGFTSLVMPFFLRNRLWAAFFNNDLGFLFLPEVQANAAFSYFYRVEYFADRVSRKVTELNRRGRPFLLVVHTCALHWPGAFPYPYYPSVGPEEKRWSRYAYASRFTRSSDFGGPISDLSNRSIWLKKIYGSGVRYLTERFLTPVVDALEQQGLLASGITVLTSDHGEAFPGEQRDQPRFYFPQHGSSLLFGADSERAFLRMHLPGLKGRLLSGFSSTADLLPTLADWMRVKMPVGLDGMSLTPALRGDIAGPSHGVYSETGIWPLRSFDGQVILDSRAFARFYRLTPDARRVYVGKEHEASIVSLKQRAYFWDRFKLTIFPTNFGMQYFLCDLLADPGCRRDVSDLEPKALREGFDALRKFTAKDLSKNYFPPILWRAGASGRFRRLPLQSSTEPMQRYLVGMEKIYSDRDYFGGARVLDSLLGRAEVPIYLQGMAARTLFNLCRLSALPSPARQFRFMTLSDEEIKAFSVPSGLVANCPGAYQASAAMSWRNERMLQRRAKSEFLGLLSELKEYLRGELNFDLEEEEGEFFSSNERDIFSQYFNPEDYEKDYRFRLLWDGLVANKLSPDAFYKTLLDLKPDALAYQLPQEELVLRVARYTSISRFEPKRLAGLVACNLREEPLPLWYRFLLDQWVDHHSPLRQENFSVAELRRALVASGRVQPETVEYEIDQYRRAVADKIAGPKAPCSRKPARTFWADLLKSTEKRKEFMKSLRR